MLNLSTGGNTDGRGTAIGVKILEWSLVPKLLATAMSSGLDFKETISVSEYSLLCTGSQVSNTVGHLFSEFPSRLTNPFISASDWTEGISVCKDPAGVTND